MIEHNEAARPMQAVQPVYHFTDTARLPWILTRGELRPGRNKIGNFPSPDFLWATTDERGDRTSSADRKALQAGLTRTVRFTLAAEDFEPWPIVHGRSPQWTPDQVERLETIARSRNVSPLRWWCRETPLPAAKWLLIETRSYTGSWKIFEHQTAAMMVDGGGAHRPEETSGEARASRSTGRCICRNGVSRLPVHSATQSLQ